MERMSEILSFNTILSNSKRFFVVNLQGQTFEIAGPDLLSGDAVMLWKALATQRGRDPQRMVRWRDSIKTQMFAVFRCTFGPDFSPRAK